MNRSFLCFLAFLCGCLQVGAQLTLNSGDSYTYEFSSLAPQGVTQFGAPSGMLNVFVNRATLESGDLLQYEMFENTAGTPICSRTVGVASAPQDFFCTVIGGWTDLQGSVRFTMLSGSVTIDSFDLFVLRQESPSFLNQYGLTIVPVPEPNTIVFVAMGALIVAIKFRHSSEQTWLAALP